MDGYARHVLARVARFEFEDAVRARHVLPTVRAAARELVEGIPGWRGVVQLIEPGGGRATVVHFLDDAQSLAAAEATFDGLSAHFHGEPAAALAELRRARRSIEVLDVALLELDRLSG